MNLCGNKCSVKDPSTAKLAQGKYQSRTPLVSGSLITEDNFWLISFVTPYADLQRLNFQPHVFQNKFQCDNQKPFQFSTSETGERLNQLWGA